MDYKFFKVAAISAVLLVLTGCSSAVDRNAATVSAAEVTDGETAEIATTDVNTSDVICYHEKKIGSNRKFLRCLSKADRDKMSEESRAAWLRSQRGSATSGADN